MSTEWELHRECLPGGDWDPTDRARAAEGDDSSATTKLGTLGLGAVEPTLRARRLTWWQDMLAAARESTQLFAALLVCQDEKYRISEYWDRPRGYDS